MLNIKLSDVEITELPLLKKWSYCAILPVVAVLLPIVMFVVALAVVVVGLFAALCVLLVWIYLAVITIMESGFEMIEFFRTILN